MNRLLGTFVVLAAAVATLAAQTQPQTQTQTQTQTEPPVQGPTFRTGIDLIAVDVAVSDRNGKPVEDLLAPDFAVKIDGEVRRVVSAEHVKIDVDAARREAADPFEPLFTTNLKPPNGRMFVIAVDQIGTRLGSARALLNTAANFLKRLSPADRVALVAYPPPGIQVGFTNDHLRLRQAMERIVGRNQAFQGRYNIGLYEAVAISERGDGRIFAQVVLRECPRLAGPALEQCERDVLSEADTMVRSVRQDTTESLRGLYDVLIGLSVIEGQKTLILISEGMVLESPSDLDFVIRAAAYARVSVHVLVLDVPRHDITVSRLAPTATEDRDMQVQGLGDLAAGTRGSLYYVAGTGEGIFERLATETLAYYMLGVEQAPGDRDDRQHRIDVEVRRQNVTVRSRRAFVLSSATTTRRKAEETLMDALKSPFGVAEIPLRVTTFTQKDRSSDKARVIIAADVGQPGGAPEEFTVGYVLLDAEGKVVLGNVDKQVLSVPNGAANATRDYLAELVVDPGSYELRLGVVDATGRRGGIIREVKAWKLDGEEFALGDLLIGDAGSDGNGRIRPGVEPRVGGNVGAFLELYSTNPGVLDATKVNLEIADDQDSPALLEVPAQLVAGAGPSQRVGQGVVSAALLPPGRYVARARVLRGGKVAGLLARPFILNAPADGAVPVPFLRGAVAQFNRAATLQPELVRGMLDAVEKRSPALKGPLAEARAGRYGPAALEALTAGDEVAAAFFKGLEWYAKGQLNEAATQLHLAAGPRREFFPAAFYLGAVFAAAGRDRDAAGVWQMAIGKEPRPPIAYLLLADARLRDGQPDSVVDVLKPAHEQQPADDDIAQRLAAAYLMTGRYQEALPVLERYLSRHSTDQTALFAAVFVQYHVVTRERLAVSPADQARLAKYVQAYTGPYKALLSKYLQIMRGR
ncbi:MAG: VWA domain-containing protein [Acidobacteria bacterium]|nr:VWA domain-containing protein [Acidobacteriota bacterium]